MSYASDLQVRIGFFSWADEQSAKYAVDDANAVKEGGNAPKEATTPPLLIRLLCCGSLSFHWWVDTCVGLILSAGFAIATAAILSPDALPPARATSIQDISVGLGCSN